MSTVQTAVGSFVWHECRSTDVERSKRFYTELLGWEIEVYKPGELDYAMVNAGGTTHGGFGQAGEGAPSHWIGHVAVDDLDATIGRAKGAGGTVIVPRMDMPEIGAFAVIADPQGAIVSVYQPAGDDMPVAQGVFLWDELHTGDVDGAKSFYGEVFGWKSADMDVGEIVYTIFKRDGDVDAGGLMKNPGDGQGPAAWMTYLATDDVDATVAKATELGATVHMPGDDVPGVGRIAVLSDPAGAMFGLFKPNQPAA